MTVVRLVAGIADDIPVLYHVPPDDRYAFGLLPTLVKLTTPQVDTQ